MVTRGNVAIYCYNALTAKTWDVTESTNGELTSSAKSGETILSKYFSDFVNEDGEMKLVEEATVTLSGSNTTAIGQNQVKIYAEDIVDFINAEKEPKKGEEEVTYYETGATDEVVAYVPAEVASIANLAGRKVDVIFGKDNEVAYIVVTDDSVEGVYVTAFEYADEEIEIDGEVYDIADEVSVNVYGHNIGSDIDAIKTLLVTELDCLNTKNELTRNIVAEFILNGDDEIESINFKFSVDGYASTVDSKLAVNEFIVEKISSKNVLTVEGTAAMNDLDDYEDEEPRVIKNGEVAEVTDIEVGDVVTEVVYDGEVEVMIVVTNTVEGEVADYLVKTNSIEIDGTEYKVVAAPLYNDEGDVDDYTASTAADVYDLFEDEEVTAYLNMAGEIVALVGESEATGMVLGVVTDTAELDEDSDDVEYIKLRILSEDGSEKKYSVYNDKSGKNVQDASEYEDGIITEDTLAIGTVIMFSADSDRNIKIDDVTILAGTETGLNFKSNTDVDVEIPTTITVDRDDKKINDYRFTSSTVVINPQEEELISNWDALVAKDTDDTFVTTVTDTDVYLFTKGTKVVYVVAWIEEANYGASDTQYGIVVDTRKDKDENDDTIYVATILVDGVEEEYECTSDFRNDVDEGDFISFDVSDGEIDTYATDYVKYDIVEYIADLAGDTMDVSKYTTLTTATSLKSITVESIETVDGDEYIVCEEIETKAETVCACGVKEATNADCTDHTAYVPAETTQEVYDLANGYIVYSLADGEEIDEINEGDYVLVVEANDDADDGYEIVIVL